MDTQNQNNDDQWIQIADQASDIIPTAIDSKPHDYFLHLFGEKSLDL